MFAMLFDMLKWLAKEWWLWLAIFLFWTKIYRPRARSIPTRYNVRKHPSSCFTYDSKQPITVRPQNI